jgi:hypothetical protein
MAKNDQKWTKFGTRRTKLESDKPKTVLFGVLTGPKLPKRACGTPKTLPTNGGGFEF